VTKCQVSHDREILDRNEFLIMMIGKHRVLAERCGNGVM
jgi:hypothetical protein